MKVTRSQLAATLFVALVGCSSGGSSSGSSTAPPGGGDTATPAVLTMEDSVHDLINAERAANGRAALTHDDDLRRVARAHSHDMIERSFFAHTNPDGASPFDRMSDASISYTAAGENIAWNSGYSDPAQVAVTGWMNSAGHRANILNSNFTHAGLGVSQRDSDGAWYFTQVFSRPTGSLVLISWKEERRETDPAAPDQGASSVTIGPDR